MSTIEFNIDYFDYPLEKHQIAQFPANERDRSKLLVFSQDRKIFHRLFLDLPEFLPSGSLLVRNISKVLQARLYFQKATGAQAQIFLLEPISPSTDPQIVLQSGSPSTWKALLKGGRLRVGSVLYSSFEESLNINVEANIVARNKDHSVVEISWSPPERMFYEVLENLGRTPLPPYIKRADLALDKTRYQTIYASTPGSVAAPTAGLHFTAQIIDDLQRKGIGFADVVLHIGTGTFKPISTEDIFEHKMHYEQFQVTKENILKILNFLKKKTKDEFLVAVGTTSVRTLESLHWISQRLIEDDIKNLNLPLNLGQYEWMEFKRQIKPAESIEYLLELMEKKNLNSIYGTTNLYITPNYKINFFDAIITNFHQPRSTLLLLIYTFVGDYWRSIYNEALEKGYRFLSYGDSSLLWNINRNQ
ncbi:MAG: S-adenosylmethionine:tRNA ribosyltransferase-isomerase [Ignavibacteria bacterium]|nr:S-adenosylmethionine:tRNA ribosyltransferase-isomerase [Ignavibacteria bacterium]